MYYAITKYNEQHHASLYNMNIREAINKVTREKKAEANNITIDTFSPQRNEGENIIKKVENLTINDVGNNIINGVTNLTINGVRNNIINKAEKLDNE